MLIELFGLPGAGKTYLSNNYIKRYSTRENKIINLTEKSRTDLFYKIKFRIYKIIVKVLPKYKEKKRILKCLLNNYEYEKARFNECYIESYIDNIVLDLFLFEKYGHSKRIYFLDEGIPQQIINMAVNYNVRDNELFKIAELIGENHIFIGIDVSVDLAKASIISRDRHVCYIDNLKPSDRDCFLKLYDCAYNNIKELYACDSINRTDSIDDKFRLINTLIEKRG